MAKASRAKGIAQMEMPKGLGDSDKKIFELAQRTMRGETSLKAELGLTEKELEGIYAVAYNLYRNGKYGDARLCFAYLCMFDPTVYKYVFGIASCFQAEGQYQAAGTYYAFASGLDQAQPAPFLHLGECLLALSDRPGAKTSFERAIKLAGEKADYKAVKSKAAVILENLKS